MKISIINALFQTDNKIIKTCKYKVIKNGSQVIHWYKLLHGLKSPYLLKHDDHDPTDIRVTLSTEFTNQIIHVNLSNIKQAQICYRYTEKAFTGKEGISTYSVFITYLCPYKTHSIC